MNKRKVKKSIYTTIRKLQKKKEEFYKRHKEIIHIAITETRFLDKSFKDYHPICKEYHQIKQRLYLYEGKRIRKDWFNGTCWFIVAPKLKKYYFIKIEQNLGANLEPYICTDCCCAGVGISIKGSKVQPVNDCFDYNAGNAKRITKKEFKKILQNNGWSMTKIKTHFNNIHQRNHEMLADWVEKVNINSYTSNGRK